MIVRKLKEEERKAFGKICRYAFQSSENNYENIEFPDDTVDINQLYGIFEDDKLVTTAQKFPFDLKLRGSILKCNGIAAVATKPEYRNRGYIKAIFKELFTDMEKNEEVLSILYPFKYSFYEKLGYYCVQDSALYQFKIKNIRTKETATSFQFKEVEEITEDMKTVYSKIVERSNYMAIRTESMWKRKKGSNYKFICYNECKTPVGYIMLHFGKKEHLWSPIEDEKRTISVWELFYLDNEVKQAMFNFLWQHRDQRKYVTVVFPTDEIMTDYLKTPRIKSYQIRSGSMLRIIDIQTVLEKIQYLDSIGDFKITLNVSDFYHDKNNGIFEMERKGQKVFVRKTSKKTIKSDLTISIGLLTQLIAGYRSIDELIELRAININPQKKELLTALFPKTTNFLRDFF